MSLLGGLFNNKAVLNTAMGALKGWMEKDGITAIFIIQSDREDTDTPGMDIRAFNQPVGLITGADYKEYLQFRRWKDRGCLPEEYTALRIGTNEGGQDIFDFLFVDPDGAEKEVENGL